MVDIRCLVCLKPLGFMDDHYPVLSAFSLLKISFIFWWSSYECCVENVQGMCRHPCSSLHSSRVVSPLEHRVMSETLLRSHNLFISRSINISSRPLFQPMLQDSSIHQDLSNSSFQSPVIMNKLSQIMGDSTK